MTQLLKNIERQLEFVVIEKLAISGQECCTFLLIVRGRTGQSTSRALQQRFRTVILQRLTSSASDITYSKTRNVARRPPGCLQ
jgi:hypothetical protein